MLKMKARDVDAPIDMGTQGKEDYDNGFSVSVIQNPYSYGGSEGLFELAVITEDGIHYKNSVAQGDVRGYLTKEDVDRLTLEVKMFNKYDPEKDIWYGAEDDDNS